MESSSTPTCSACGSRWRLPLLLAIVLAAILLTRGRGVRDSAGRPADSQPNQAVDGQSAKGVSLTIDYGFDRRAQYESAKWHKGMTIGDLLNGEPRVSVAQQGSGESSFLTQLNGVANEGAGGWNWTYTVNGQRGDRSFALFELQPGDHVLWTFGPQQ